MRKPQSAIERVERQINQEMENSADPFVSEAVKLLDTIPGVGESVAQTIISADLGEDGMFPER
jgi:3-methyladenine DNA glycosylase/8-oxoguanine DNA glycosylase